MSIVPMPSDTNQETTKTIKRSMREAWPTFDEEQFRADLKAQNEMLDMIEDDRRFHRRNDIFVNCVVVAGIVMVAILLVSGKL